MDQSHLHYQPQTWVPGVTRVSDGSLHESADVVDCYLFASKQIELLVTRGMGNSPKILGFPELVTNQHLIFY